MFMYVSMCVYSVMYVCMYMYMYYVNCLLDTCRCECVYILFFLTIVRIRF